MPKKYEHIVRCRLSKRQRLLYEEYMSRARLFLYAIKFVCTVTEYVTGQKRH